MKFLPYFQLFYVFGFVFVTVMSFPKRYFVNPRQLLVKDKLKLYRDQLSQKFRFGSGLPKVH